MQSSLQVVTELVRDSALQADAHLPSVTLHLVASLFLVSRTPDHTHKEILRYVFDGWSCVGHVTEFIWELLSNEYNHFNNVSINYTCIHMYTVHVYMYTVHVYTCILYFTAIDILGNIRWLPQLLWKDGSRREKLGKTCCIFDKTISSFSSFLILHYPLLFTVPSYW